MLGINTEVTSNRPLVRHTWLHVTMVRNSNAQTYQFYINGVPESPHEYQHNPTGGSNTSGYIGWSPSDFHRYFDGVLDEIRIYNRALTHAEIRALFGGPAGELLAYYPFNGNANDESGNGNHGTLLGGATVTDALILGDNASDALSLPHTILDELTNFTFAGLLRINTLHTSGGFLAAANPWVGGAASFHPDGNGFNITYDATIRKWRTLIVPPYQVNYFFDSDTTIEDNNWHHVSVTRDNTTARLYIDGVQAGNPIIVPAAALVADSNGFIVGQEQDFVGGGFDANQSWAGEMDNVRIYNRALTDEEILDIYFHDRRPSEEFTLSVDTVFSFPGDTILVPVNVQFPTDSIYSSAEITFSGHHGLLDFIEIETDSSLTGIAGWIVQVSETDSLLITATAGAHDISGEGVLFWLEFAVPDTVSGFIPIAIESALFNESSIPTITSPGGVHVIGYVAGDVSLDGDVHAFDASLILKYLVGTISLNPQQLNNANVSTDTTVSPLDASLILRFVVGLLDSLPYDTSNGLLLASGDIGMEDDEIQPGQTIEIPLNLSSGNNILSFRGVVTFNRAHLVYNDVIWSQLASDFTIETNAETGEITFAGSSTIPMGQEGVFGTLRFTVSNTFHGNETAIRLQKLRWNEEPEMENVASATLSIVLTVDDKFGLPTVFALKQNFPNPFNPGTNIRYELPKKEYVRLTVYDLIGKEVAVLVDQEQPAGKYDVKFNAVDLGSGVYFYRFQAGGFVDTKKLLLLK